MITINRKNPTEGEVTSSLTSEAGGLHFDGAAGNIDIASPPDLGTKFSFEFILKADSTDASAKIFDFGDGGRFSIEHNTSGLQVKSASSGWVTIQSPSMLADLDVHHMVITVDNTALTLYDNSNLVATATIAAPDIDNCADARIGTYFDFAATESFHGSISRARFYNRVLSGSEVKEKFENQNLEFSEQWGSQTELSTNNFVNSGFAGFSGNAAGFTTSGSASNNAVYKNQTFTAGKKYRLTFTLADGNSGSLLLLFRSSTGGSGANVGTIESSNLGTVVSDTYLQLEATGSYELILSDIGSAQSIRIYAGGDVGAVDISAFSIVEIGAVTDYCLSEASPTASLMLADRSTNGVDATISASGVTAIAKPIQVNATAISVSAATARTPSDGVIVADNIGAGKASPTYLLETEGATADHLMLNRTNANDVELVVKNSEQAWTLGIDRSDSNEFVIATGESVGSNEKMTISSSGNVGLSRTPSANQAVAYGPSIQVGQAAALIGASSGNNLFLSNNALFDNSDWKLTNAGKAGQIFINVDGSFTFRQERTSGAAGDNISWDDAMTISSAGETKITRTGDEPCLELATDNAGCKLLFARAGDPTAYIRMYEDGSTGSGSLRFATGTSATPVERLKIDTAGLVSVKAGVDDTFESGLQVIRSANSDSIWMNCKGGAANFNTKNNAGNAGLAYKFLSNGTEKMSITSGGNVLVGTSAVPSASVEGFCITGTNSGNLSSSGSATIAYNHLMFYNGNGNVGYIGTSGTSTSYSTSSDYRLKENLTPLTGALGRIEKIPVYRFNFKADSETTVDGFVAHEAQAIVPEAVTGEKDAMKTVVVQEAVEAQPATYWEEDDELPEGVEVGDEKTPAIEAQEEITEEQPDYQGIDQSKLVPLLVAAVKELKAKVEALENA